MSDSILTSVKTSLGLQADHTEFDDEILLHVNSVFSTLTQLGVGPVEGFQIEDDTATWDEFIGTDPQLNAVKTYIHLRVKLLFDPPEIGFVLTAMKEQIQELEWRLNVTVDSEVPETTTDEEEEASYDNSGTY